MIMNISLSSLNILDQGLYIANIMRLLLVTTSKHPFTNTRGAQLRKDTFSATTHAYIRQPWVNIHTHTHTHIYIYIYIYIYISFSRVCIYAISFSLVYTYYFHTPTLEENSLETMDNWKQLWPFFWSWSFCFSNFHFGHTIHRVSHVHLTSL